MTLTQQESERHFFIDTETTPGYLRHLPEFLENYYVLQHKEFRAVKYMRKFQIDKRYYLIFRVFVPKSSDYVDVTVETSTEVGHPIHVIMNLSRPTISYTFLQRIYDDLLINVQFFEEYARQFTLYLAFIPGQKVTEERYGRNIFQKLFTDSMVNIFIFFIPIAFIAFALLGPLIAPIVIVAAELVIIAFAGKLIAVTSDWKITKDRPEVTILEYTLTEEEAIILRKRHKKALPKIRKEIYDKTLAVGEPISCEVAHDVFQKYEIECTPAYFSIKTINLYNLVNSAAKKFNLSIPTIVVSNVLAANAAATGLNSRIGTMLVTTGALVQLEEDDLLQVVGHELSHLKGHDPVIIFLLVSLEYLGRIYIVTFIPQLANVIQSLSLLYYIVLIGTIFFVGKFFEAKCDLESAIYLKDPKLLANALRKIGFRQLVHKGRVSFSLLGWLRLDPHPPIGWRIRRLDEIEDPSRIKHPFLKSAFDCIKGFFSSFIP